MSTVTALAPQGGRSDSPAKPKDYADVPKETAHERTVETAEENNNTDDSKNFDVTVKCEPTDDVKEEKTDSFSVKPDLVLTDKMIKEEKNLEEEALEKERKLEEEREKLWSQMSDEDRTQRYQRLQFLLSKSNMYTQYLIERMTKQKEEEKKKKERQMQRLRKKEEKLKEERLKKEELLKEQKAKEIESSETCSQTSEASVVSESGRRSTKRKSSTSASEAAKLAKATPKRSKKGIKGSDSQSEDKENSQGEGNSQSDTNPAEVDKKDSESGEDKNKEQPSEPADTAEADEEEEHQPVSRVINGQQVLEGQPRLFTGGVLRKYQIEGYNWLKVLFENGVNGILADEMGLGKTVQCVALIAQLVDKGVSGPFLIVGPLSTVPNWVSEFKRFTPRIPIILYHGSREERRLLRNKMKKKHFIRKNVEVQPVIITSYEIAMNDRAHIHNFDWKYLIVDEGHRLKNTHCRLIRELRMYHTTHRLLLTGTPLQNNLSELWSLLNFLLPEIFDDLGSFEAWFDVGKIQDENAEERIVAEEQKDNIISMLHQILTPFMLRRLKCDVELIIPPKREVLVMAPLTNLQKEYYTAIVDKTIMTKMQEKYEPEEKVEINPNGRKMRKTKKKKVDYSLMVEDPKEVEGPKKNKKAKYEEDLENWAQNIVDYNEDTSTKPEEKKKTALINIRMQGAMMQLRKCCNHPYLLEHPIEEGTDLLIADESIVKMSGKMLMLDRLLPELKKRGHKVLLFSQMVIMLNILESYCELRDYKYCRLDGGRSVEDRGEQIKTFNEDKDVFIFLVSTRAGGLGINLTAADTVIIYDSDWNPQSDLQAQDRCHRIGQTRPVLVYRFVTANTIDQRIVERAAAKRKLEKLIIHKGKFKKGMNDEFSTNIKPINAQELLDLLRSRDHEGVVQCSDKNVISNEDLESLLDRSDLYEKMEALKEKRKEEAEKKIVKKKGKAKSTVKQEKTTVKQEGSVFKVLDVDYGCYTNKDKTDSQTLQDDDDTQNS